MAGREKEGRKVERRKEKGREEGGEKKGKEEREGRRGVGGGSEDGLQPEVTLSDHLNKSLAGAHRVNLARALQDTSLCCIRTSF